MALDWITKTATKMAGIGEDNRASRMVDFMKETLAGFDTELLRFLIRRGTPLWSLPPRWMKDNSAYYLVQYADLIRSSNEMKLEAASLARPDVADLLSTAEGQAWVLGLFSNAEW